MVLSSRLKNGYCLQYDGSRENNLTKLWPMQPLLGQIDWMQCTAFLLSTALELPEKMFSGVVAYVTLRMLWRQASPLFQTRFVDAK